MDLAGDDAVEELVLSALYSGVIEAELDQDQSVVIVKSAIGRDVQPSDLDALIKKFKVLDGGAAAMEAALRKGIKAAEADEKATAGRVKEYLSKVQAGLAKGEGTGGISKGLVLGDSDRGGVDGDSARSGKRSAAGGGR